MKLVFSYAWLEAYEALPPAERRRVAAKLKEISRASDWPHEALKGRQFKGLFKLRIGDYRMIYRILPDASLDFLTLGHRSEIYR